MKYCVYGVRLRGDKEVRYVGFTRYNGQHRLRQHFQMATREDGGSPFGRWLYEHRADVEVFSIWEPDACDEAVALEHGMIEICTRLGHRLFNRSRVPAALQIAPQDAAA
jgi:hypothetical protein